MGRRNSKLDNRWFNATQRGRQPFEDGSHRELLLKTQRHIVKKAAAAWENFRKRSIPSREEPNEKKTINIYERNKHYRWLCRTFISIRNVVIIKSGCASETFYAAYFNYASVKRTIAAELQLDTSETWNYFLIKSFFFRSSAKLLRTYVCVKYRMR